MTPIRKSAIKLKRGHTYEEFVLKCYESRFTYEELCRFLGLKFEQARDIYDGVSALLLVDVGVFKEQAPKLPQKGGRKPKVLPKAPPRPLEYLPTGTNWRKA